MHAQEIGADAIIGMRYDATEFSDTATEVWLTERRLS